MSFCGSSGLGAYWNTTEKMKDYSLFLVVLLTHKGNVLCVPLELGAVKLHLGCLAKSCFALKFKWCRLNRLLVKILACFVWDSEFCFVRCMLSGPYFVCRFESIRGTHRGMCSCVSCACCNRDLTIYHPLVFFYTLVEFECLLVELQWSWPKEELVEGLE